jgi:alpha-galactosidase
MGWNSYNYYNCYPNETIIKSNAQGLVDLGFPKLGYTRVTPDCGWPAENRTANGSLTWNATTFPSGFIELGQYLHGLGLEFGVYSGAGVYQCGSGDDSGQNPLPASLGHETQDVATFTAWGADFLKYDNCWPNATLYVTYDFNFERTDPWVRFVPMANALNATSREFELEICQWGSGYDLGYWAPTLAETWRVSNDIATKAAGGSNFWGSIWRIANQVVPYTAHTGVGKYPDMDMLM